MSRNYERKHATYHSTPHHFEKCRPCNFSTLLLLSVSAETAGTGENKGTTQTQNQKKTTRLGTETTFRSFLELAPRAALLSLARVMCSGRDGHLKSLRQALPNKVFNGSLRSIESSKRLDLLTMFVCLEAQPLTDTDLKAAVVGAVLTVLAAPKSLQHKKC